MKGRAIPYSRQEMVWLEANRLLPIAEYHRAFCDRFGRGDVRPVNLHSLRKRMGWKVGRTGRFPKAHVPHNKGKHFDAGGRSVETRFKKGQLSGRAAERVKSIGTERLSKDGYRERKIHNGLPMQSRWRAIHLLEWEAVHGPVPAGHALKCLDGDRQNTDPSNWELVSRSMLPRLAGGAHKQYVSFDHAEPELRPALLAAAKIEQRSREARR